MDKYIYIYIYKLILITGIQSEVILFICDENIFTYNVKELEIISKKIYRQSGF